MSVGENSRFRRSVVVLSLDRTGRPQRKPWLDRVPRLTDVNIKSIRQYIIQDGDTWYNLASRLYGDATLWWIIAEYNNVVDPFTFLAPGVRVIVPSRDVVFFDVLDFETPDTFTPEGSPL